MSQPTPGGGGMPGRARGRARGVVGASGTGTQF